MKLGNHGQTPAMSPDLSQKYLSPVKLSYYNINDSFLFTGSEDGKIKQWNLQDKALVQEYSNLHSSGLRKLEVTPNKKYLISLDDEGDLKQWDLKNLTLINDYPSLTQHWIYTMCLS
jgi:WD40 repeat protein